MTYLNKILKNNKIDSADKAKNYIAAAENNDLAILTAADLSLCSESRIYQEYMEYKNTIFDIPLLKITNAKKIKFVNCIFLGKVIISQKHENQCEIYLDYCIFTEELKITGVEHSDSNSIYLVSVNTPSLRIEGNKVNSISFVSCKAVKLIVLYNEAKEFQASQCKISYPSISNNLFSAVSFPYTQINLKKQTLFRKNIKMEKDLRNFNCFVYPEKFDFDEASQSERKQISMDTLRFLLDDSNISVNQSAKAHARYLEAIESQKTTIAKLVLFFFGALLKPARLFILLIGIFLTFGFIYQLPFLFFNAPGTGGISTVRNLDFLEAFYYSGITFTTIGYGEITPVGFSRLTAVVEGIMGILLSSAFLVSLIRKYTE